MSDSLTIRSSVAIKIDLKRLSSEVSDVLRFLLNQKEHFSLEFETVEVGANSNDCISMLEPRNGVFSFIEHKYLKYGVYFSYDLDEYWNLYSDGPVYQFCITDIPRRYDDIFLMICIAMAVAVARIFSVTHIIDGHGVLVLDGDVVPVENLLNHSIDVRLPLTEAMHEFYKKMPLRLND